MFRHYFDDGAAIQPEELQVLQEAFNEIAGERHIPVDSPEAKDLGAVIISVYKAGYRTKSEMLHMLGAGGENTGSRSNLPPDLI